MQRRGSDCPIPVTSFFEHHKVFLSENDEQSGARNSNIFKAPFMLGLSKEVFMKIPNQFTSEYFWTLKFVSLPVLALTFGTFIMNAAGG